MNVQDTDIFSDVVHGCIEEGRKRDMVAAMRHAALNVLVSVKLLEQQHVVEELYKLSGRHVLISPSLFAVVLLSSFSLCWWWCLCPLPWGGFFFFALGGSVFHHPSLAKRGADGRNFGVVCLQRSGESSSKEDGQQHHAKR